MMENFYEWQTKLTLKYRHGLYYLITDCLQELGALSFTIIKKQSRQNDAKYLLLPIKDYHDSDALCHLRIDEYCDLEHGCLLPYHLTLTKNKTVEHAYFHLLNEYTSNPVISQVSYHSTDEYDGEKKPQVLSGAVKDELYEKVLKLAVPLVQQLLIFRNEKLRQLVKNIESIDERLLSIHPIQSEEKMPIELINEVLEQLEIQKNAYQQIYLYCNQAISEKESLPLLNIQKLIEFFNQQKHLKKPSSMKLEQPDKISSLAIQQVSVHKKKKTLAKSKDVKMLKVHLEALLVQLEQSTYPHDIAALNAQMLILEDSFDFKRCDKNLETVFKAAKEKLETIERQHQENTVRIEQQLKEFCERLRQIKALRNKIREESQGDVFQDDHLKSTFEFLTLYYEARRDWLMWRLDGQKLPEQLHKQKLQILQQSVLNEEFSSFKSLLKWLVNIAMIEANDELFFKLFEMFPKVRDIMNEPLDGYEGMVEIIIKYFLSRQSLSISESLQLNNLIKIENFCFERSETYRENFFDNLLKALQYKKTNLSVKDVFMFIFYNLRDEHALLGIEWIGKHCAEQYHDEFILVKSEYQKFKKPTTIQTKARTAQFSNGFFLLMLMGAVVGILCFHYVETLSPRPR